MHGTLTKSSMMLLSSWKVSWIVCDARSRRLGAVVSGILSKLIRMWLRRVIGSLVSPVRHGVAVGLVWLEWLAAECGNGLRMKMCGDCALRIGRVVS
jgi:hypothetical protein